MTDTRFGENKIWRKGGGRVILDIGIQGRERFGLTSNQLVGAICIIWEGQGLQTALCVSVKALSMFSHNTGRSHHSLRLLCPSVTWDQEQSHTPSVGKVF